ncbi:MAG: hypothetical protein M8357_02370 [Desulfobulbaceae bacterium]|nr:hypothetical protein [Desulfobulbaceae bacterium]
MFSLKKPLQSIKPGVNRRVHLFAAALLWTVIGTILIIRGWGWINPAENGWFIAAALLAGTLKSVFILDRTARRTVERITKMRDGTCLGAVYSWKTWILVAVMVTGGVLLRTFFEPGRYTGTLYIAIGWALLLSSRYGWLQWSRRMNRND